MPAQRTPGKCRLKYKLVRLAVSTSSVAKTHTPLSWFYRRNNQCWLSWVAFLFLPWAGRDWTKNKADDWPSKTCAIFLANVAQKIGLPCENRNTPFFSVQRPCNKCQGKMFNPIIECMQGHAALRDAWLTWNTNSDIIDGAAKGENTISW